MRAGRRSRRTLQRIGFTTRASCLFAAGLTAIACGFGLGEINLLRAGVLAAVIPCLASFAVSRSRLQIALRRRVEPERVVAGGSITASVTLVNNSPLPTTALLLEDRLPERMSGNARFVLPPLRPREQRTVSYRVAALGRGRYRIGPLQVRLGDPFGLIELTRGFTATSEVVVAPSTEELGRSALPRSGDQDGSATGQGLGLHSADDASTREYRVGDDLRKIHWRTTARTGAMMVRQEEQLSQQHAAVLLDLRAAAHHGHDGPDSGADPRATSSLEWAVSAAASIGAATLRSGRRFVLATDPAGRAGTYAGTEDLLYDLAEMRAGAHDSPAPLLRQLRAAGEASTTIAVLGALSAAALEALVAASSHTRAASFAMLLDVAGWPGEQSCAVSAVAPLEAAAALGDAGWHATVVRCGESVPDAWHALFASVPARRPIGARS